MSLSSLSWTSLIAVEVSIDVAFVSNNNCLNQCRQNFSWTIRRNFTFHWNLISEYEMCFQDKTHLDMYSTKWRPFVQASIYKISKNWSIDKSFPYEMPTFVWSETRFIFRNNRCWIVCFYFSWPCSDLLHTFSCIYTFRIFSTQSRNDIITFSMRGLFLKENVLTIRLFPYLSGSCFDATDIVMEIPALNFVHWFICLPSIFLPRYNRPLYLGSRLHFTKPIYPEVSGYI